jgi:hypothetical protein
MATNHRRVLFQGVFVFQVLYTKYSYESVEGGYVKVETLGTVLITFFILMCVMLLFRTDSNLHSMTHVKINVMQYKLPTQQSAFSFLFYAGARIFLLQPCPDPLPFLRVTTTVKLSGREGEHSPPSSFNFKNLMSRTPTPTPLYLFMTCLIKHRDNLTNYFSFGSTAKFRPWPPPWNFPFHLVTRSRTVGRTPWTGD